MISSGYMSAYFPLPVFHWLLQDNSRKQDSEMYNITEERERNIL